MHSYSGIIVFVGVGGELGGFRMEMILREMGRKV
jgi:hypothetical protein